MKSNKLIVMIILCCAVVLNAKVRSVSTRRDLERTISQGQIVIVLFYETQKNTNSKDKNKDLIRMYEDVSSYKPYNDADLVFLKVNVGRKDLMGLAQLYDITKTPTIVFFNQGRRFIDGQGRAINIEGFISRDQIESFIDQQYGDYIKTYIVAKENRKNELLRQENEGWKPYFYPRDMVVRGYAPEESLHNLE